MDSKIFEILGISEDDGKKSSGNVQQFIYTVLGGEISTEVPALGGSGSDAGDATQPLVRPVSSGPSNQFQDMDSVFEHIGVHMLGFPALAEADQWMAATYEKGILTLVADVFWDKGHHIITEDHLDKWEGAELSSAHVSVNVLCEYKAVMDDKMLIQELDNIGATVDLSAEPDEKPAESKTKA